MEPKNVKPFPFESWEGICFKYLILNLFSSNGEPNYWTVLSSGEKQHSLIDYLEFYKI